MSAAGMPGALATGARPWRGVIAEYRERMPLPADAPVVSLCEGGTPLVESGWLSELTGCRVLLKFDGANPTGSFKDRGMTMAISMAAHEGARAVICASTGNTSASAAAYAAKAGMTPAVLVPAGKIAMGKLAQAVAHGARLLQVDGNFDDCLRLARDLAGTHPVALVNSVNPARIEGQKSAAFEIVDALGDAPDVHVLPVGNAGNITAYWKGYVEYHADGPASRRPRMWGVQAEGAAPIVRGAPVAAPETLATAIRIGNPASWQQAIAARDDSGGGIDMVSDEQILESHLALAARDGLYCEPASAASVAGLVAAHAAGRVDPGQTIVCTLTGHGLKDTQWALARAADPVLVPVDVAAAARALDLAP
ncbi:MAG: threonine synthase [Candidatus Nanopelagicales bacterium]|jgi:threonine synthase|nr:threonine synthase [Candidatus Nanopelagicales bacterium]